MRGLGAHHFAPPARARAGDEFKTKQKDAQVSAVKDGFQACIREKMEDLEVGDIEDTVLKAYRSECEAQAENKFFEAGGGGDREAFEEMKQEAAASAIQDGFSACMKDLKEEDVVYTDKELKAFRKECHSEAEAAFVEAGGDLNELQEAMEGAARDGVVSSMKNCIKTEVGLINATIDSATEDQVRAARFACENEAKDAFIESGGNREDYEAMLVDGARENLMEDIQVCVEDELETRNISIADDVSNAEIPEVFKECKKDAKSTFLESGGSEDDFLRSVRKGSQGEISGSLRTCLKLEKKDLGIEGNMDATELAAASARCMAGAQQKFVLSGGDLNDFERQRQKAAVAEALKELRLCVDKTAEEDELLADDRTALAAVAKGCKRGVGKSTYAMYAKSTKTYRVGIRKGARAALGERVKLCVANKEGQLIATSATITGDDRKQFKADCSRKLSYYAMSMGLKTGGRNQVAAMQDGARDQTNAEREACVTDKLQAVNITSVGDAPATVVAQCARDCAESAKAIFQDAGLNASDAAFADATKRGAGQSAAEKFRICLEEDDSTRTACKDVASSYHIMSGGDVDDLNYDIAMGQMEDLTKFFSACEEEESLDCLSDTKTYFFDTLKGAGEDWDPDALRARVADAGNVTEIHRSGEEMTVHIEFGTSSNCTGETLNATDAANSLLVNLRDNAGENVATIKQATYSCRTEGDSIGVRVTFASVKNLTNALGSIRTNSSTYSAAASDALLGTSRRRLWKRALLGASTSAGLSASEEVAIQIASGNSADILSYGMTGAPTAAPTSPTSNTPTAAPSSAPTGAPTGAPTSSPTPDGYTNTPSTPPTQTPSSLPSTTPTALPTESPVTQGPRLIPTGFPTPDGYGYTHTPSTAPTQAPSSLPSTTPTALLTGSPVIQVSSPAPSLSPTVLTNTPNTEGLSYAPSSAPVGTSALLTGSPVIQVSSPAPSLSPTVLTNTPNTEGLSYAPSSAPVGTSAPTASVTAAVTIVPVVSTSAPVTATYAPTIATKIEYTISDAPRSSTMFCSVVMTASFFLLFSLF